MNRLLWLPVLPVLLTGCEWLSSLGPSKVDNPVMGEPPPRVPVSDARLRPNSQRANGGGYPYANDGSDRGDYKLVSASTVSDAARQFTGAQIVATVDESPILASQILERYAAKLKEAEGKATPEQLLEVRKQLIQRDLPMHVQRQLLVNALKRSIPAKNRAKLDELIDKAFAEKIEEIKRDLQVDTKYEVNKKLNDQGSSLDNLRDAFANEQMAAYYFQQNTAKARRIISRREMLEYYDDHLKDYAIPAEVRWQEIQVTYSKHGGQRGAFAVVEKAVADLKDGADFADIAKKYSDGVSAKKGGMWDWTQSGSLTDETLEQALFNLPVGRISKPMKGKQSYRLIRVVDRHRAGWKSFGMAQADIKKTLEQQAKQAASKAVINRLVEDAVITTVFDDDPKFKPVWRLE
ncbi:MAG: peptidylprolyl isomerase [Planctomycetaceae bacterium]